MSGVVLLELVSATLGAMSFGFCIVEGRDEEKCLLVVARSRPFNCFSTRKANLQTSV